MQEEWQGSCVLLLPCSLPRKKTLPPICQCSSTKKQLPWSFTGGKIIPHNSKRNNNESPTQHAGLNFGDYAKIDEILGPFIEHDTSNDESLLRIESLSRVPPLFTGATIVGSSFTFIITSCEVYGRDATVDDHLENQGDSFPHMFDASKRHYPDLKIMVDKQSDGGVVINKLILGAADFNLLVTGGILLSPASSRPATVDPTTHPYLVNKDLNHASLHYRDEILNRFQAFIETQKHATTHYISANSNTHYDFGGKTGTQQQDDTAY